MSLPEGTAVRSWVTGQTGRVHLQQTFGERQPRRMVRFTDKLGYHPAWMVRPFVWEQQGAQR